MFKKMPLIIIIVVLCTAFLIPERISKKADKVIAKFYDTQVFQKETIVISEAVNKETPSEFANDNLFKISNKESFLGYGYIGKAPGKAAYFDYLVLFDEDFIITKSKVLVYREEYGGEIGSKRWLKQFVGIASTSEELVYNRDIVPISGATISVRSMTRAMNDLLMSISLLQKKSLL